MAIPVLTDGAESGEALFVLKERLSAACVASGA
jgi:hypothetical protein